MTQQKYFLGFLFLHTRSDPNTLLAGVPGCRSRRLLAAAAAAAAEDKVLQFFTEDIRHFTRHSPQNWPQTNRILVLP